MITPAAPLRPLALLAALFALGACTAEVTEAPANTTAQAPRCDDGQQNGDEAGVDCGGSQCAACAVQFDCDAACASTADGACLDTASCKQACLAGAPGWNEAVTAAFTACVTGVPLCYQTLDDCMLGKLYPDPVVQPASLSGKGFDAYEGHTVHAGLEMPGGEIVVASAQTVSGGSFAFSWAEKMSISGAGLMLYYIDLDESGSCALPGDAAGSTFAERSPGFGVPSWTAEVTPPPNPADFAFVCDSF